MEAIGIHYQLETETGKRAVFNDMSNARSDANGYIQNGIAVKIIVGGGLVPMSCDYWSFVEKTWVHQQNAALFKWQHTRE
jgi:hypothetical protein